MTGEGSTQAAWPKAKLPCPADNCNETRASKQTLSRHIMKAHEGLQQGVQQGVQQLKNFLSSPMLRPSSSPGPPVVSPASTTASIAASSTTTGSTTTPARLVFGQGAITQVQVHDEEGVENADMEEDDSTGDGDTADKEVEEEDEEDLFEDAADDDKWLHEALDKLAHEVIDAEEEASRQELKVKINEVTQKLQTNSLHTKHMIDKLRQEKAQWRETLIKQRQLEDENERLKSECDSCRNSEEVIERKNANLDVKDAKIAELGKKIKKLEGENKKNKDEYKTDIDTVHDTLANIAKRNNDLKAEVEKQKKLVETLKVTTSAESVDVTNVEVHSQGENQRVDMSHNSTRHRCNACAKDFNASVDLERHMEDKHFQGECAMCKKEFATKKQAFEHICEDTEVIAQKCGQSYCKKEFASSQAMKVHMKKSHFGNQRTVCTKCSEILSNEEVKRHMDMCGKSVASIERTQEKSMEVCRHWRRGRCDRGSGCNFSHVGRQDAPRP